jgi:hypothetical protein
VNRAIAVTVSARAPADAETTFDAIVPIELPRIFRGLGPLPAVLATREQTGEWDHVGASRVVVLSDGSEVGERITAYDRPRYFAYVVGPFRSGLMRNLVVQARGEWWFARGATGDTEIRWNYTFGFRRYAPQPVGRLIALLWRRYANRVLALAIDEAERAAHVQTAASSTGSAVVHGPAAQLSRSRSV